MDDRRVIEHPFWWDTTPAIAPGGLPPLDSPRVDVAIIGAGYTGLAAASRLARAGASVLVLEREDVGSGASSRNAGQVLTGLRLEPAALVRRLGPRRARELFEISLESIARLDAVIADESIECEYERSGHIQAAWKASHFETFREEQQLLARVFHHRVELVPVGEQRTELGSARYHGLLVDERSGGLNPAKYVHGLARAAGRAGARIATGTAVDRVDQRGNRWTLRTAASSIDAGDVLVASDAYTTSATPALQRRFVPVGSYIIVTEPLDEAIARRLLPRRRMAFDSKHFLYYFRLTTDRRLLFGGRAEFTTPTTETTRRAAAVLRRGMVDVFPELRETRIDYAWGGLVAFTRDQLPRAGRLHGIYYAGGYGGHGIAMATYLGELIGRRMSGESISHPLFDDRFPPIPFHYGKPWFLPLVGAYYRFKDWVE